MLYRVYLRRRRCHDKKDMKNILRLVVKLLQRRQTPDSTLVYESLRFFVHKPPDLLFLSIAQEEREGDRDGEGWVR